jgi:hypothetical protein
VAALVGRIAHAQNRLERELVGAQGVSITAHASLHHFSRLHDLPRACGLVQQGLGILNETANVSDTDT